MRKIKHERIFVSPEFKELIKIRAAREGCSIIEYSRHLARQEGGKFEEELKIIRMKRGLKKYDFF